LPIVAKLIGHNRSYRDIAGYWSHPVTSWKP